MKISELAKTIDLKSLNTYNDKEIDGVYISDMVSDIITCGKPNLLLVTLQKHKSLIAAANLVDVAAVVFVKGIRPDNEVLELANKTGIGLFVSDVDTWTMATKLMAIGIK